MRTAAEIHLEGAKLSRRIIELLKNRTDLLETHDDDDERIVAHALMILCCSAFWAMGFSFHHLVRLMAVAWGVWSDQAVDPDVPDAAKRASEEAKKLLDAWQPPKGSRPL